VKGLFKGDRFKIFLLRKTATSAAKLLQQANYEYSLLVTLLMRIIKTPLLHSILHLLQH
jgi:hypothetical protein